MVYVLRSAGCCKIGCTAKLRERYNSKRMRAEIVLTIDTGDANQYTLERQLHKRFASKRVPGSAFEYFYLTEADIDSLLKLPGAARYKE